MDTKVDESSNLQLSKVPSFAKRIMSLPARFSSYDVAYDSQDDMEANVKDAAKSNVVVSIDLLGGFNGNDLETCEGRLVDCINYLKLYLEADDGYVGAQALEMLDKTFTDEDFTLWCAWMNAWLPDWIDGIKENDVMKWHFKQDVADKYANYMNQDISTSQGDAEDYIVKEDVNPSVYQKIPIFKFIDESPFGALISKCNVLVYELDKNGLPRNNGAVLKLSNESIESFSNEDMLGGFYCLQIGFVANGECEDGYVNDDEWLVSQINSLVERTRNYNVLAIGVDKETMEDMVAFDAKMYEI